MRILVVDDEVPTRQSLRQLLASTDGDHELAGEATDAFEAIACCRAQPIDLVLMDAKLPGMTGAEAVRQLEKLERPPTIIFLASDAASNPAMAERRVAGCLLKPVRADRLREALNIARRLALPRFQHANEMDEITPMPQRRTEVSARYRGGIRSVAIADIIFLQADQKYVNVRHLDGELLADESLRSFEQEFPDLFLRIHRNALVARSRLKGLVKLTDGTIRVELSDCDDRLAVSRRHLAEVRRWLREQNTEETHRLNRQGFDARLGQQQR
ncbi:response regulator transcription factor [Thiorhodococcus mannitoliphagus]|uniref:Response regulator transcription factor n=1 Tax=Thiorhodococcus mannitoliphagus TaxID=329406 RepID=A0A6P1DVH7_9GAMM|nr:LytTR family DNA-binding domain-containing protein [Thiorhodococcus mannitoliphagus]NEX22347.1 response regulator transcription factor [Thiorhodococcus mannitoliphagus]